MTKTVSPVTVEIKERPANYERDGQITDSIRTYNDAG